ncbi:hypothetical protein SAMN05444320_102380 [Streptoalloteichus hindustanus]|uniref:Uncharacterized protein n=1 Tax=Streptoalloteichus hindustanus TaxID=2017 RepID=A0A1M4YJC3_STRHI|nr:hypothetical protein SAMN05444320_102380 [Streptoalloteichus hindustanus]
MVTQITTWPALAGRDDGPADGREDGQKKVPQ